MSNLAWDEPRDFRRAQNVRDLRVFSAETVKSVGIVAGCLLGLRFFVGLNPRPTGVPISWPNTVVLALGVGVVAGFIAPWLIARVGMARVVLSDKGINHNVLRGFGWQINFYPWTSVSEAQVYGANERRILQVSLKSGAPIELALSAQTSSQEVEAYVARYLVDERKWGRGMGTDVRSGSPAPPTEGSEGDINKPKAAKADSLTDDRHKFEEYKRLMEPVISGDLTALDDLARTQVGFPAGQDPWVGQYWLSHAIGCGTPKVVRWMLENGASPVFRYDDGYSPLHSAIERDKADKHEMMVILIEFGANVNARGINDWTPAHMAAANDDVEALRILHAARADFSVRTRIDDDLTPLEEARALGSSDEVIAYLESVVSGKPGD